ncbi:MAG TPA: hypothetical protein VFH73_19535 [Polyangia bacterium]|jgi:hypothetical protein|nr:hypothetical protein [Polyangia bacterium]
MSAGCVAGGLLLLVVGAVGCGGPTGTPAPAATGTGGSAGGAAGNNPEPTGTGGTAGTGGMPLPGTGGNTGGAAGSGNITVIATAAGGLSKPTDLEFNPYKAGELWVTNQGDNSMTIIGTATTAPVAERRRDSSNAHFMPQPAGIAFGAEPTTIQDAAGLPVKGTFATCGESRNGGDDFMGPVMWTPDLRIFAIPKAMREPPFNSARAGSLGSHIDMLHLSPLCTGIAWEGAGNVYWTYSGISKAFVRYDFRSDHWIGNDNHTDGAIWRYLAPGLGYVPGVPSHIVYRPSDKAVYFADTANGRIVKYLPASATMTLANPMRNQDGLTMGPSAELTAMVTDVVPRGTVEKPSGLEIKGDTMYVTDNANGKMFKFSVAGEMQGVVQTGVKPAGLAGLTVGPDNKIYFVDMVDNRVLRLESGL